MEAVKKWFCFSAAAIFFTTGVAKISAAWGDVPVLQRYDPILGISFTHLMLVAGVLELMVASFCLFVKSRIVSIIAIAWLAAYLATYRLGLWWIGWHRPCPCLGNLTDAIHVSPQRADNIMNGILAYLLVGSCAILFCFWRGHKLTSESEAALS
jgi:hypothetical protein